MTGTTTTRMSLYKPAVGDLVSVVTDLNNNLDALDLNMNFRSCTSSTRPSLVWAGLSIYETNTGSTYVSNGSLPASGSWINIPNAGTATTVNVTGAATGALVTVNVTADTLKRFQVLGSGKIEWGTGAGAVDTNLYRSAANILATDDTFSALAYTATGAATTTDLVTLDVTGDTQKRLIINGDGKHEWGSGGATVDTNLYRSAVDTLKTDDAFIAGNGLSVPAGVGAVLYRFKTSNETVTSSTTLQNDDILTFAVEASATYIMTGYIKYSQNLATGATAGMKVGFAIPASSTFEWTSDGTSGLTDATTHETVVTVGTGTRSVAANGTVSMAMQPSGSLITVGAGTLVMQWAQVSSSATGTIVRAGSWLKLERVA